MADGRWLYSEHHWPDEQTLRILALPLCAAIGVARCSLLALSILAVGQLPAQTPNWFTYNGNYESVALCAFPGIDHQPIPGETFLGEFIKPLEIRQTELAEWIGLP